ncbi:integral membrane protein [Cadophora sp. DSE1049]|nr:integral membrane protein [Cadophora sp. DSE1049]
MLLQSRRSTALAGVVLLTFASVALAHGHDDDMTMNMGEPAHAPPPATPSNSAKPDTYFQYGEHSALMLAHIVLMTIGWVFVLPISVMFSISRSRFSLSSQFVFLAVNAIGVLLATIYNANTPDLYPNNAHHKLGWVLTWGTGAQLVMGVIHAYARKDRSANAEFTPISAEAITEHQRIHSLRQAQIYRLSNDSGQGTEPNTESLRSTSLTFADSIDNLPELEAEDKEELEEKHGLMHGTAVDKYLTNKIPALISSRFLRILDFFYNAIDRLVLILGFITIASGIVTYGGFFMGSRVFSGLAHFIKGGVFFWYGILTLGRWAGCFADIGWAWNINPSRNNRPSAEFVENFLIFFYGSTNVFLEHLAAWGKEWTAQDLEHLSLTLMFFGGGLCGMVIESKKVRDLLNTTKQSTMSHFPYHAGEPEAIEEPRSYRFSMNPLPALVILLLGMMMSSHHQESMVSTMIHTQWGTLLMGAAFARGATYILYYLSPPTSILPGRPPTELITAFCLMAGGMIFMASARDTVMAMENNGLDAMFIFTVSMGVITFLMAWIIMVIAIKGWAVRKENKTFAYHGVA